MGTPLNVEVLTGMGFDVLPAPRPTTWWSRSADSEEQPSRRRWPRSTPRWPPPAAAATPDDRAGGAADHGQPPCAAPTPTWRWCPCRAGARPRGDRRPRRRPRRDDLQRQRAARAGGRPQAHRRRARAARHGPRLRHRRGRRRRPRLRQRRAARAGRHRGRLRHRLPAAARACSTTPASASRRRSASAGATCPPRSRGISTREALRRLDADPSVELIVLVSKPPAAEVAAEMEEFAAAWPLRSSSRCSGPGQPDLTAATEAVLRRLGRAVPAWPVAGATALPDRRGPSSAGSSSAAPCATRPCWSPPSPRPGPQQHPARARAGPRPDLDREAHG